MAGFPTLVMVMSSGVVVLGLLAVVIRFDLERRVARRRFERRIRRGTARLLADAERARREPAR